MVVLILIEFVEEGNNKEGPWEMSFQLIDGFLMVRLKVYDPNPLIIKLSVRNKIA